MKGKEDPMVRRSLAVLLLLGIFAVGSLSSTRPSWAETLVQQNVDTRVVLAFWVGHAGLQRWLPAPWQVDRLARGPSKGANLTVSFIDRLLNQDGEAKVVAEPATRLVALVVPVKHGQTGETALFDIREYNAGPQGVPGPYKTGLSATIRREATLQATDLAPGAGSEMWEVKDSGGGLIEFRVVYQRGIPSRARPEVKLHSAVDASSLRIYRPDVGTDMVKSTPAGIDRVRSYQFRVTAPELRPLFDGTEQLVSIVVLPWYVRQVFLP
jgi:hypothetical protein